MRPWFTTAALVMLAACTSVNTRALEESLARHGMAAADPGHVQVGDWIVMCLGGQRDAVGAVRVAPHCRVEKYDRTAVVRIDAAGLRLGGAQPMPYCPGYAWRAAVDGRPIQDMPIGAQIAALRSGSTFAREIQESWPGCTVRVEQTGLAGFDAAFSTMMGRWSTFNETAMRPTRQSAW